MSYLVDLPISWLVSILRVGERIEPVFSVRRGFDPAIADNQGFGRTIYLIARWIWLEVLHHLHISIRVFDQQVSAPE